MIVDLQNQVNSLSNQVSLQYKGQLDDLQVERVINANIIGGTPPAGTGTYTGNDLLYQHSLTGLAQDIKTLNFPTRVMIYTWKGQRLAIPIYDATDIIYP